MEENDLTLDGAFRVGAAVQQEFQHQPVIHIAGVLGLDFDEVGGSLAVIGFEHVVGPPFQVLEDHRAALIGTVQFDPVSQEAERLRAGRQLAGFGGFLGLKHDGHPGPKAIWEGMKKVRAFALALESGRAAYTGDG